ncbi:hypothetical protein JXD38_12615 [candidate division WOR-3 bacterium]|nr:hypothetical protein [candidate division WOR-3 bacterium]
MKEQRPQENDGKQAARPRTAEEVMEEVKALGTQIKRLKRDQDELVRRQTRLDYGQVLNYYLKNMAALAGDREEFEVQQVVGAHNYAKSFLSFLNTVRDYLVREGKWPVSAEGETVLAELPDWDRAEVRQQQEEFHQEWPKNTLDAVKFHVRDLAELVGRDTGELGDDELPLVYQQLGVFIYAFGEEVKRLVPAGKAEEAK